MKDLPPEPAEYEALRGYLRAAIAMASAASATDEHAEALAESIIHLSAVRATLRQRCAWSVPRAVEAEA